MLGRAQQDDARVKYNTWGWDCQLQQYRWHLVPRYGFGMTHEKSQAVKLRVLKSFGSRPSPSLPPSLSLDKLIYLSIYLSLARSDEVGGDDVCDVNLEDVSFAIAVRNSGRRTSAEHDELP